MKKFNKNRYLRKLKFKRYWQTNSRYFYIGIPCLLCLVLGIYFAYSKFFVTGEEEVIRTTVGEFIYGDIIMASYIDGQYSNTFPEKKTGINVEKVVCDNGVTASWDEDKWGLYVTNLSKRTKCSIYFVTPASCGINDNVSCINSREGLATLANEVNNGVNKSGKIIYLTSDLNLGGKFDSDGNALDGNISWIPIGTESNPFSGTFDGNGHIISNMYINRPNNAYNGLFGYTQKSFIKNLGLISSYVIGYVWSSGIAVYGANVNNVFSLATVIGKGKNSGICTFECTVKNSYNGGNIKSTSTNNTWNIGDVTAGVAGGNSTVYNSYNYGSIVSLAASVGGISGWNSNIYFSYNSGQVNGENERWTGGILGAFENIINLKSNYNLGTVNGGGIVGVQQSGNGLSTLLSNIKSNYFSNESASYGFYAYKSNQGAEPLSQEEMPSVISVINGDNAFVEDTNNINNGYPILKWQAERENN